MTWDPALKIPTSVVGVEFSFKESEGTGPGPPEGPAEGELPVVLVREARYSYWIRYDDGTDDFREGDLLNHMTPEEKTMINDFLTTKIAEINDQVLPGP